ncbi:SusC/RagA family TonB-linked outer membrane protein [Marivirga sp. S37H4]|uniref:SusC/RagA family TonB-linked outer membrane protein n=1 Tax=Marivirga aurantiaca TaxID=2802615 RepID=A0A935C830_9BACT|nr:SusC/RagA family TonB-linked outer membrane protein [Marivirga aurantiaca]MBK6263458.1 SusC/RagA family TonB-linked outer membrane protein [Marivirga aurantiaca]
MKKILLTFFVLVLVLDAWAQDRTVRGTVTDAETGEGLPGVNVVLEGTNTGVNTDLEGNYQISVPSDGGVLVFSFIGMANQEISIGQRSVVDVEMAADIKQLSEVVVTALGIEREQRSLGYSVQEISGDDMVNAGETNMINSMQGKVAGVQISGNGAMGGSSNILIRGANSIAGNNQPLFVVDGVPIDNSNFNDPNQQRGASGYDYGNAAQDINPDDIQSMSVLKGASAAALYGNRASNGVIIITTKKGRRNQALGLTVNSSVTFSDPLVLPEYQNEFGGGFGPFTVENGQHVAAFAVDQSWGPRLDGRPVRQWYSYYEDHPSYGEETPWVAHPDNIRNFYETGVMFNNNISLSGGNDQGSFRLSYTNMDQSHVVPNADMQRNTINFNSSYSLSEKLTASAGVNYVHSDFNGRPSQGYGDIIVQFNHFGQRQLDMEQLENYYIVEATGEQRSWNRISSGNPTPLYADNPYWIRNKNLQNDSRSRVFGNATLSYDFTENLSLTGRALIDFYTDRRQERVAEGSVAQSSYMESVLQQSELNTDLILKYDGNINEDFSLTALLGGNIRIDDFRENTGTTVGGLSVGGFYSLENSNDRPNLLDRTREREIYSWFASATVGFRDLLYIDATLRNDVSSTLPEGDNSYFYPSLSGTFIFTELDPLNDNDILSFGKLRASVAQVGNDTDPYRISSVYAPLVNFGDNPAYSLPNALNNQNLRPEQTVSYEVGAELRFLSDRIYLDGTYYHNTSTDQIFEVDVSGSSGYRSQIINAGEIINRGIEFSLGAAIINTTDFNWNLDINWARNRNEVVELAPGIDNYRIANGVFEATLDARIGQPYGSIYGANFVLDEDGNRVIGEGGNYLQTSGTQPLGTYLADWTGGVRNSFSYRGLNFSFLIDTQMGGSLHSVTNLFAKYSGMVEETVDGNIRQVGIVAEGVVQNEDGETVGPNTTAIDAASYFSGHFGLAAAHVYDATYVKLREMTLGYSLPQSIIENTPFTSVNFGLQGRNLAILFKKVPHIDPEASANSGNVQGLEGGALPTLRSYGFKVNFGF